MILLTHEFFWVSARSCQPQLLVLFWLTVKLSASTCNRSSSRSIGPNFWKQLRCLEILLATFRIGQAPVIACNLCRTVSHIFCGNTLGEQLRITVHSDSGLEIFRQHLILSASGTMNWARGFSNLGSHLEDRRSSVILKLSEFACCFRLNGDSDAWITISVQSQLKRNQFPHGSHNRSRDEIWADHPVNGWILGSESRRGCGHRRPK